MNNDQNHAEQNARGWMESIREMVNALKAFDDVDLLEDRAPITIDGDVMNSPDDVRERITESPLSVQVRSGWHSVGEQPEDVEFEILLSTGGPALRIIGDLGCDNAPENPRLQYQDWGIPWTEYVTTGEEADALQTFCEEFFFGE